MTNNSRRFFYLANIRLPTEKAHGIQIMNTCSALANLGADIELVIPSRKNSISADPFLFYELPKNFSIKILWCPNFIFLGKFGGMLQVMLFFVLSAVYVFTRSTSKDVIYSRQESLLFFPSFFRKRIFWETHTGSFTRMVSFLLPRIAGVICITNGGKDFYVKHGVPSEKILVAHDGVDIEKFSAPESREKCRERLGLPQGKRIVAYTGSIALYKWKGVDILLEAAGKSQDDTLFLFVGGSENGVRQTKEKHHSSNIRFISQRPHGEISFYLKAADVLVIPNKKGDEISEKFTSPMKLFEYMASGTPIVASDLPSIREILSEDTASFFQPNDPDYLLFVVKQTLSDYDTAQARAKQARAYAGRFSWSARASAIHKQVFLSE